MRGERGRGIAIIEIKSNKMRNTRMRKLAGFRKEVDKVISAQGDSFATRKE